MSKTCHEDAHWSIQVLDFWFKELTAKDWFRSSVELDRTIANRFNNVHQQQAKISELADDATPEQALASVIVLDQFSRNMYRGNATAFAFDKQALQSTKQAMQRDMHSNFNKEQKQFLFMPFMHAENASDQATSLILFTELGLGEHAVDHKDIIDRFGRFPHRNEVLGRKNTPEENEYLKDAKRFGQ